MSRPAALKSCSFMDSKHSSLARHKYRDGKGELKLKVQRRFGLDNVLELRE